MGVLLQSTKCAFSRQCSTGHESWARTQCGRLASTSPRTRIRTLTSRWSRRGRRGTDKPRVAALYSPQKRPVDIMKSQSALWLRCNATQHFRVRSHEQAHTGERVRSKGAQDERVETRLRKAMQPCVSYARLYARRCDCSSKGGQARSVPRRHPHTLTHVPPGPVS